MIITENDEPLLITVAEKSIRPHGSVGRLEFDVPFQHKYGYIRDEPHCLNPTGSV